MKYITFYVMQLFAFSLYAQSVTSIAEIAIELDQNSSLPLSNKVSFDLIASKPEMIASKLVNWRNITVDKINDGSLSITMFAKSIFSGEVAEQHYKPSFIIDFTEKSTQAFISGFVNNNNQPLSHNELASYVSDYIKYPTYIHGFNIASLAAEQQSGDCTEYAVLTTALARSLSIPSRIIIGTVIFEENNKIVAYGHAWSEIWIDGKWHIEDAAMYGSKANHIFYLPASELGNEGPGFAMSLLNAVMLMPSKINKVKIL